MRQYDVKFANFTCLFGDQPMVEYLDTIVINAFLNDAFFRKYGSTTYHFVNAKLTNLGTEDDPDICIIGNFVKRTFLERTQILDADHGILEDNQTMESAPSAFFLLRLLGHRVVYFAETPHAPELNAFEVSVRSHINKARTKHINKLFDSFDDDRTKKKLNEDIPKPSIRVTPITGGADLDEFVQRFEIITHFELVVHERNQEIDGEELVEGLNELNEYLGTDKTKLVSSDPDGIDADHAKNLIEKVGKSGNQSPKLTGKTEAGERLTGTENDFALTKRLENPPATESRKANRLFKMLMDSAQDRLITLGNTSEEVKRAILRRINPDG